MATWFISRHAGAIAWARAQQLPVDHWVSHLDPEQIAKNDTVIGTLPVHLAAEVCERGALFYFLTLDLPPNLRGTELSIEQMQAANCKLRQYFVKAVY